MDHSFNTDKTALVTAALSQLVQESVSTAISDFVFLKGEQVRVWDGGRLDGGKNRSCLGALGLRLPNMQPYCQPSQGLWRLRTFMKIPFSQKIEILEKET